MHLATRWLGARLARYLVRTRQAHQYDLKNIFDLVRYLLPNPPVPQAWRRRLLVLGSGDATRAICSTLIAGAFESVQYPVSPHVERRSTEDPFCPLCEHEILHVRHHSLFVPRDFDVSPYFQVVKPTLADGFDHQTLLWHGNMEVATAGTAAWQAVEVLCGARVRVEIGMHWAPT